MAFPSTSLRWMAETALGADLTAAPSTWSWTDTSQWVMGPDIRIDPRGRQSEFGTAPTAKASLKLINNDGRWVERYPMGAWYGLIGLNTPMRFMISPDDHPVADTFTRTVSNGFGTADTGDVWTVVGTASDYAVTSGVARTTHTAAASRHYATIPTSVPTLDWTLRIRVNALSTGANQNAGILFRYVDTNNSNRAELAFNTDQTITCRIINRLSGSETTSATVTTSLTHVAASWYRLRVQYVRGATNQVRVKAWLDGTTEPTTWTTWGAISAPATTGLRGLTTIRATGNTNTNATIDFDDLSGTDGWWVRHAGYLDALPRRWADQSASVLYTPTSVSGLSGRLQQGDPIQSAIRSAILGAPLQPRAYWPCEDGSQATMISSGLVGGQSMAIAGIEGLGGGRAAGSDPLISVTSTGLMRGPVTSYTPGNWNVQWLANLPTAPATTQALLRWYTGGTYQLWQLVLVPGGGAGDTIKLQAFDSGWVERLSAPTAAFSSSLYGQQLWFEVTAAQSGSDIAYTYSVFAGGVSVSTSGSTVINSSPGAVTQVAFGNGADGAGLAGMTLGHIVVYDGTPVSHGNQASVGWGNEASYTRMARLGQQESIRLTMAVPTHTYAVMGPPSSGTLIAQLREVETAEQGILYDDLDGGITLLGREARANQAVALTLDVAAHNLAALEPDNDNQQLTNEATVSQPSGTSFRYQDTTSRRSISRAGAYPKPFSVNLYNASDLRYDAEFRVALGTVDDDRYTAVTFSLTGNPSLITSWLGCDIGSRIQVTNTSALFNPDPIDLIIEGYSETISNVDWRVTLYTGSAKPWTWWIAETGTGNQSRVDSGSSTLTAGVTSSATSLSVTVADPTDVWVTGAVNFDINVGGERMTVTNISSATSPQTFTVTRSVNGIAKAQTAGTKVSLWQPSVVAL